MDRHVICEEALEYLTTSDDIAENVYVGIVLLNIYLYDDLQSFELKRTLNF